MAESKLLKPEDWEGMTYLEVVRMLALAIEERGLVMGLGNLPFLDLEDEKKYTYSKYLIHITFSIKRILDSMPDAGYFKEGLNISTLPLNLNTTDLTWTLNDIIADIGDPEFYDFSDGFDKDKCYKAHEYLVQYYEIIIRLKRPVIRLHYEKQYNKYSTGGRQDDGLEAECVEYNLRQFPAKQSRKVILQKEGMGTEGITQGISQLPDLPYENWDVTKADHDSDYNLVYMFPTNEGITKQDTTVEIDLLPGDQEIITGFRAKASWNAFLEKKGAQWCTYERIKVQFEYKHNSGNLGDVQGKPQSLKWIAKSSSYPDGDLGNPHLTNQLFFVDQPLANGVPDDIYHGDNTNKPASIDIPVTSSLDDDLFRGFTYNFWLVIVEDWDYEGGLDYYSTT